MSAVTLTSLLRPQSISNQHKLLELKNMYNMDNVLLDIVIDQEFQLVKSMK